MATHNRNTRLSSFVSIFNHNASDGVASILSNIIVADTESVDVTAVDVLADQADTVSAYPVYDMTADKLPYQLANSVSDYYQHFLKGCKW